MKYTLVTVNDWTHPYFYTDAKPHDDIRLHRERNVCTQDTDYSDMLVTMVRDWLDAPDKPMDDAAVRNDFDSDKRKIEQKFVEQIYTKFMNIVSDGRNMSIAQVDSIAQGRVWTGTQGVQVGIVDEIGGIEDAIKYAANLVNASDYYVVEYPRVKTQMELMMESFAGSGEGTLLKKIFGKKNVSQAEQILKDIEENNGVKTYVRMPYNYEFSY